MPAKSTTSTRAGTTRSTASAAPRTVKPAAAKSGKSAKAVTSGAGKSPRKPATAARSRSTAAKPPTPAPAPASASAPAVDPGTSDAAVERATGKNWQQWFAILDKAGAAGLKHPEIVRLLIDRYGVGHWWAQSVTVGYERARGLREKGQTAAGFQISASKTINAPAARVFAAWNDLAQRRRWLSEPITIRTATPAKSLRITWSDGRTSVEVYLTAKGDAKTSLSVQHTKIQDKPRSEQLKSFWGERLDSLKGMLEG